MHGLATLVKAYAKAPLDVRMLVYILIVNVVAYKWLHLKGGIVFFPKQNCFATSLQLGTQEFCC